MHSGYDEAQAEQFVASYREFAPRDLALRVYTSRLIGREPALVLHGGGNTSVKLRASELDGSSVDCLYVKGSGWDLAEIEPAGFAACRLQPLRSLCKLQRLSDDDMVRGLRSHMLDPSGPNPSVEALLHAFLPAKYVDHTHAESILKIVDQPDAEARTREVFPEGLLFVPYIMPGFVLLRRVVELANNLGQVSVIVLEKHGIFTFGDTAKQSYENMIWAVTQAEKYVARKAGPAGPATATSTPTGPERLSLTLRGALARHARGRRQILRHHHQPELMALLARSDLAEAASRGPVTPDHVIRTKPWPLLLPDFKGPSQEQLTSRLDEQLGAYVAQYDSYFDRHKNERNLRELDPLPRVVLAPGVGVLTLGDHVGAAQVVADLYAQTARVVIDAEALGRYDPVSEADLFDVEYWSLEQAKLKRTAAPSPLRGYVALVTGAARGIGLACAQRFLDAGAHVLLVDRDQTALEGAASALQAAGGRAAIKQADVTHFSEVKSAVSEAVAQFGGLDLVVSNAGTAPSGALHEAAGDAELRQSLEVNLLGHQNVARASTEALIWQGIGGALLFNASKSAFNQGPNFGPYAVAKAALVSLMRQYAVDLGPHRIRANAVNADRIRTDLFGDGVLEARCKARGLTTDQYFSANLLERETSAVDVADAFLWLATAQATTGCVVTVDGGNASAFPR